MKVSRSSLLWMLVLAALLAALPGTAKRFLQNGWYLFSEQFFRDMLARLSGPGRLRFILQPLVAIVFGVRDGLRDARAGSPAFLWALLFHSGHRPAMLRSSWAAIRDVVALAILADLISQMLIFRQANPFAALLLGPVLISAPYSCARALANQRFLRPKS